MAIDIAAKIIKYKKSIFFTFIALMILSAIAQVGVSVNYNVADYLPEMLNQRKQWILWMKSLMVLFRIRMS